MDGVMVENTSQAVKLVDDLWFIGDFDFEEPAKDAAYLQQIFRQMPGARKHLIIVNHESELTPSLNWKFVSMIAEVLDGRKKQPNSF